MQNWITPTRTLRPICVLHFAFCILLALALTSCGQKPDPNTVVMLIESGPTNLDPRVGLDAFSERIDQLLFDALLTRDDHFDVRPGLAERWEAPDPRSYVFHLRRGVRFNDGRPLTSRDVKWTFDSILNGTVKTGKVSAYRYVASIETPDDATVIFHMKEPDAMLPWNVSEGASGIVPYGSGPEFNRHPIGSGPFRFVSLQLDKEVVLERNDDYWGAKPKIARVRFAIVPDFTTQALELRKGSADIALNSLTPDTVLTLERDPRLEVERAPGSIYNYLAFNLNDPVLKDERVRQAIACAIDRHQLVRYLWRDMARPAASPLPPESWAYDPGIPAWNYDPERARRLLDQAGYPAVKGVRFHLLYKTTPLEVPRLQAAIFQQQLREVGIVLDIRTLEFGTFFTDIVKGAFQMYSLRWIGGNEAPDIFDVFYSANVPPRGANRGHYSNPQVDTLIEAGRRETDEAKRKQIYIQIQQIVGRELPYVSILYLDNVLVHSRRVRNLHLEPSGNYNFLKTAELAP
ncbi:MAG TPA: ABC transporter substrate-binding protein [Terriglobales bacterium]|jgi:peptide/nickel transport system substrate-binding protein|nr:ABC transporter substrate-binding protein [Terriglobales bacterium]